MVDSRTGLSSSSAFSPTSRRNDGSYVHSSSNVDGLIAEPQSGSFGRRMLRWRTPYLGWVKMFINPSQISISDVKDVSAVRTKAGFVLQYAGEQLTNITIGGSTGSAGIEGINILRAVYRSEQLAFDQISVEMERTAAVAEFAQIVMGQLNSMFDPAGGAQFLSDTIDVALNYFQQPFPTLASLAANVELFFQGVLYRGYFKDFRVDENADTPGIFTYTINFVAHSRQGERRNFMPWHKQPYNPIGLSSGDSNPLSYYSSDMANLLADPESFPEIIRDIFNDEIQGRSTSTASGNNGTSLRNEDLEDLV